MVTKTPIIDKWLLSGLFMVKKEPIIINGYYMVKIRPENDLGITNYVMYG